MRKKKIIKLEINKEDILNLSHDESQQIIGGAGGVLTVDFSQCPGNVCNDTIGCGTGDCTDEDCTYSDCAGSMGTDCEPWYSLDCSRECTNGDIWACGTRT